MIEVPTKLCIDLWTTVRGGMVLVEYEKRHGTRRYMSIMLSGEGDSHLFVQRTLEKVFD